MTLFVIKTQVADLHFYEHYHANLGLIQQAPSSAAARAVRPRAATAGPCSPMPGTFLITVIYRRRVCSELVLSEMLEISAPSERRSPPSSRDLATGCGAVIPWSA